MSASYFYFLYFYRFNTIKPKPTELMIRLLKRDMVHHDLLLLDEDLFEKCVVCAEHKSEVMQLGIEEGSGAKPQRGRRPWWTR